MEFESNPPIKELLFFLFSACHISEGLAIVYSAKEIRRFPHPGIEVISAGAFQSCKKAWKYFGIKINERS